jgi:hypothetical protein
MPFYKRYIFRYIVGKIVYMKRDHIMFFGRLILIFQISSGFIVDAPSERFYVTPERIHTQALRDVKGIISIRFVEVLRSEDFEKPPAEILTYNLEKEGNMTSGTALTLKNINPLSGFDWEDITIRRFPVLETRNEYYRIVYDVEKNLQAWILGDPAGFVRATTGHWVRGEFTWFKNTDRMDLVADVFYLLNGKPRKFYELPKSDSRSAFINSEEEIDKLPFRKEKEFVSNVHITQIKNGFAKVYTQGDAGGDLKFAGWIKLVENGKLTVWKIVASGC